MTLSLASYAVLLSKHFQSHESKALGDLVTMHEGIMLHLGDGDVRVRVRADAEPARDVVISRQANGLYKATAQEVHESIRQDSRPTPVSDWLFHCFVASTLRSPFLYAASPSPLPLSTVHTTSSGITNAQRELLMPALASLGATFSPNLDERCSHLIVPTAAGSDFSNSPKVVACTKEPLRQYIWIVTSAWLAACQAQRCRVPERQFLPSGMAPPAHSSADAWLYGVSLQTQAEHVSQRDPLFGDGTLLVLPPSSLFLDDEPLKNVARTRGELRQQQLTETPVLPSRTRGWWIDESSAAHVMKPLSPLPYARVSELMSLSSSDPQPASQELEPPLSSSQMDCLDQGLEEEILQSPPAGSKGFSKSPASSLSGSRTSQSKRNDIRLASDCSATAPEDTYCAVERLMDERFVKRGDCSFSEFHVKWLGTDSDSWVPECDVDPELVASYRAQRRNHPLPSSSPCMTRAAVAAAAAAITGSSTLSSSSATKSSSAGSASFGARRGHAIKSTSRNLPLREHVSFCSQLTPVALARTSQVHDGFLSPVVNGSLLVTGTSAIAMSGGGTSNMVGSALFCSPAATTDTPVALNGDHGCSSSQSQLQSSTSSVTSTQHPSEITPHLASQKSSLSVEFPPSFPYRLSQQDPAVPVSQYRMHNAMDIGDYCVGTLPSFCGINVTGTPQPRAQRLPPTLASDPPTAASVLMPNTPVPRRDERTQLVTDSACDAALAVDGSSRKRRRLVPSRNFGRVIVSLLSKDDAMYSNAYLSSLGACLSDVNCGAFDILVIDNLRASKKLLCALAGGKWVVSPDYLHASKKQGVLVQPEQYEYCEEHRAQSGAQNQHRKKKTCELPPAESIVERTVQVSLSAPRHWRQQLLRAFDGLLVCVDVDVLPSRSIMAALLVCGGATVADSLQRMHHLDRNHKGGFVVRPAFDSSKCIASDAAESSRWPVVFDMDILQALCQPLLHRMPFNSVNS